MVNQKVVHRAARRFGLNQRFRATAIFAPPASITRNRCVVIGRAGEKLKTECDYVVYQLGTSVAGGGGGSGNQAPLAP